MDKITKLKEIVDNSHNIVFFGGAGVSTESGIPDFRSSTGVFSVKYPYRPEEILSHDFFYEETEAFYTFYRDQMLHLTAKPNKSHEVLAELEKMGKLNAVITQNIDGFHQMAGSKVVHELHGSIHRNYCTDCNAFYDLEILNQESLIPKCTECGGIIKPDVVLYGEHLNNNTINQSKMAIANADVLIVGGTSLIVYPASGLVEYFKGDDLILINKSETKIDSFAKVVINDSIGKVMAQLI